MTTSDRPVGREITGEVDLHALLPDRFHAKIGGTCTGVRKLKRGEDVPLSEDEQRILGEIEQQLYASDPALAREIADSTVYRHAARNLKWAIAGFLVGTAILLGTLHISFVLAFVGFLVLLGCTLSIVRDLRRMGKAGITQLSETMKTNGIGNAFGSTGQKMRERFRREDDV